MKISGQKSLSAGPDGRRQLVMIPQTQYNKTVKQVFPLHRYIFIFTLLFFCVLFPAAGQAGSSVWTVSKNNAALFLGGSIHALRSGDFPLPAEFDRALAQSSMLVLEADTERMANTDMTQYLMRRMVLPDGKTLESLLDSEIYAMLKVKCEKFGLPAEAVARWKPSMVMVTLSVLEMQNAGFVQQGVDDYCFGKAKEAGKPLDFLETAEEQIDMIVAMGEGYENDYVKYSLNDMDNTEKELAAIVSGWRAGDAASTEKTLTEMKDNWPVLYQTLVLDRNEAWLSRLEEYLAGGNAVFVLVGLAHLHGPDGLLRRLVDSGCTVKQFR